MKLGIFVERGKSLPFYTVINFGPFYNLWHNKVNKIISSGFEIFFSLPLMYNDNSEECRHHKRDNHTCYIDCQAVINA